VALDAVRGHVPEPVELDLLVRDTTRDVKRTQRGTHAAAVLEGRDDHEVVGLLVERQR
jgi:hypothetical protein